MKDRLATALADGTWVAPQSLKKLVKDFIIDAIMSGSVALGAAGISELPSDKATSMAALVAVGTALVGAFFRAVLRWAQSPD